MNERDWSDAEWLTLQLGPVWVASALLGRSHFDELEQEAFWRAVEDAPVGDSAVAWQLMQAMTRHREWLLDSSSSMTARSSPASAR